MQSWINAIPLLQEGYHQELLKLVADLRQTQSIFPPQDQIFRALELTSFDQVKVIILGQDPYHGAGQAHGLAFSVPQGIVAPPSLRNIFKEIDADLGQENPTLRSTDLTRWAQQGVLLLNDTLTVVEGQAASHQHLGWQALTDQIVEKLSADRPRLVFLLWGNHAKNKGRWVDTTKHMVLSAAHPSPLAAHRGFWGCRHFSLTNEYLEKHGQQSIHWQ